MTAQVLNVRDAASGEGEVLGWFERGQTVEVMERLAGWLRIRCGDGEAFVSSRFVLWNSSRNWRLWYRSRA